MVLRAQLSYLTMGTRGGKQLLKTLQLVGGGGEGKPQSQMKFWLKEFGERVLGEERKGHVKLVLRKFSKMPTST